MRVAPQTAGGAGSSPTRRSLCDEWKPFAYQLCLGTVYTGAGVRCRVARCPPASVCYPLLTEAHVAISAAAVR